MPQQSPRCRIGYETENRFEQRMLSAISGVFFFFFQDQLFHFAAQTNFLRARR